MTTHIDPADAARVAERFPMPRVECPKCGHDRAIPTLYGLPGDPDLMTAAELGLLRLGGCCIFDGAPTLECARCDHVLETLRLGDDHID